MTDYERCARMFVEKNDLCDSHIDTQLRCMVEELGEFAKALSEGSELEQANELADLLFTVFVMAELLDIPIDVYYSSICSRNLKKNNRTSTGKIKK